MAIQYVDPEEMIHPLRKEMSKEDIGEVLQGIMDDDDWMTIDEIDAATDFLFDHIAAERQTHPGEVIVQ